MQASKLLAVVNNGNVTQIEALFRSDNPPNIDAPGFYKRTAMYVAAQNGLVSVIEALVRLGNKAIDTPDKYGWTPMFAAARNGHVPAIEALVRLGSKAIDTPDNHGYTPLFAVAEYGDVSAIETLVRLGSNAIDTPDSFGWTPMHVAANDGRTRNIEMLVRLGSRALDAPEHNGLTPIHLAGGLWRSLVGTVGVGNGSYGRDMKCQKTVDLLRALGANTQRLSDDSQPTLDEEEVLDVRFRVYFAQSLLDRLLFEVEVSKQTQRSSRPLLS